MEYSPFSASPDSSGFAAPRSAGAGGAGIIAPSAGASGNIASIIVRTEEAVEEETAGIGRNPRFDLQASNARKSRCLYDLSRAVKGLRPADLGADARDGFKRLREKLARNERAIKAHLEAVGEVAALLQNAIAQSQSDGTYGSGEFGWAR